MLPSPRGAKYELGLLYQSIIPSGLPDLNSTVPVYGPILGMPLLGGTLQLQTVIGHSIIDASKSLSLYQIETNYRIEIVTPFFNSFLLLGFHYLLYTLNSPTAPDRHDGFGGNVGLGISFLMGSGFELAFTLRTYLQQRSTVSFGGGFSFLL